MPVRLLTDETIGKIAAGEVVERPASVVKELLENALDAGAGRVSVAVRGGGSELIEVADDGRGMPADELALAIRRHATSKLAAFEDLDRLATLGFRGEALPSIAAVSSFTLRSRPPGVAHGTELRIDFGDAGPPRAVAARFGTVAVVRDLFANVPARRKFLRQFSTEAGYIVRAVSAYAAAYPHVAVELTLDERRLFGTDGSGDAVAAAVGVYGPEVGEAALRLEPLEAAAAVPGLAVEGWVGAPPLTRSHRQGLVFFVNGRWIQNRPLAFALEEAYHSLLMVGRHPLAVVHVRLDPAAVDVNVHPTKAEVRFREQSLVHEVVRRAIAEALGRGGVPELQLNPSDLAAGQRPFTPSIPGVLSGGVFTGGVISSWNTDDRRSAGASVTPEASSNADLATAPGGAEPVPLRPAMSAIRPLIPLGQFRDTFILAIDDEGICIIDQHVAHERVLFERMMQRLTDGTLESQRLLVPLMLELPAAERQVLSSKAPALARCGFEVEGFGGDTLRVTAVPALLPHDTCQAALRALAQDLEGLNRGLEIQEALKRIAATMACHAAVKANYRLTPEKMRHLLEELRATAYSTVCPHGRPVMLRLTRREVEKNFERI